MPLSGDDVADDALALLREAAPAPDEPTDLGSVLDVFWTFWLRRQRADDPDASRNLMVALSTFGHLWPRLSEGARGRLPEALVDAFEPDAPSHEARFAGVVSAAHAAAGAGTRERLLALERALAWADHATERWPRYHEEFPELVLQILGLQLTRFLLAAEPEFLATAARHAAVACERLRHDLSTHEAVAPPGGVPATSLGAADRAVLVALDTVVSAAWLLGEPSLTEVERLVESAPAAGAVPEIAAKLRALRERESAPAGGLEDRDLHFGTFIVAAGVRGQDPDVLTRGTECLRAALASSPAGHETHGAATAMLGQALLALGGMATERGDASAASEALGEGTALLTATNDMAGALDAEDAELVGALREFLELPDEDAAAMPLSRRLVETVSERETRRGDPPDIDLEVLALASGGLSADSLSAERVDRFRLAVAGLPAEHPKRHAYVAVLAALVGCLAQSRQRDDATGAAQLAAEARDLVEEAAARAPADFAPLGLLRRGQSELALGVALATVAADLAGAGAEEESAEQLTRLTDMASLLSDMEDNDSGVSEDLDSFIARLRTLGPAFGDDPSGRAWSAASLGAALAARAAERGDSSSSEEIAELLRYASEHEPEIAADPEFSRMFAHALNSSALRDFDAEKAREAAVLLATTRAQENAEPPAEEGLVDELDRAVLTTHTTFHNALQNYLLGFDPAELRRVEALAERLKELGRETDARDTAAGRPLRYHLMGEYYAGLVETMGPGGPRSDVSDELVARCRRSFEACPPENGHHFLFASTFLRVLVQRAVTVRGRGDEARAGDMLDEAERVIRSVGDRAPEGWAATMRFFMGRLGGGDRQAGTDTPSHQLPAQIRHLVGVLDFPTGDAPADPSTWRDPATPAWVRANGALALAAAAVMREESVDRALAHLETAVDAMAAVTDRGSDQASAEHALTSFDGDIRGVAQLILARIALGRGAAEIPGITSAFENLLHRVDKAGEPGEAGGKGGPNDGLLPDLAALGEALRAVHPEAPLTGPEIDRTAELLERGRGLLLARRMEARVDLGELRANHPELAGEFERLTDLFTAVPTAAPNTSPPGQPERERLARLRASHEFDELVARIRQQRGFGDFLRPLSAERIRALAGDGPIVVLNHAHGRCQAIVVTPRSIVALHLPAEAEAVTDTARRLREALDVIHARGAERPSPARLVAAGATVREVLAWTWHAVVGPVLELVGADGPNAGDGVWPRLWWMPTGAFHALPLHAAECSAPDCERGGCGAALESVVSSYAPGFQTLAYARSRAAHRAEHRAAHAAGAMGHATALLVAEPEEQLPGVAAVADYAAESLGAPAPLVGAAADRDTVLAALGGTSWAHFGCHAATDPFEPSGARLHLPSGEQLSVLEICQARPESAQLAFLAACGTARSAERLTDEALHVTSAFLLAGFPTAVGTLWEIDSAHAERVTRGFYHRMTGHDAPTAAYALHDAVRALRRRSPDRLHAWAAYVHAGV
ncbi:CHAT domain-containing protein [Streptomyces sedi]|uniref:CHAT domain-containing protein n=1 Tax=Streptomyces sedi TaxID=555059 RepID=A0A5C4V8V2_9ACTN|nr:CHAT domain-containing protein [Streptomyces sedi]TNM32257.1 CHAT domain-containing protein [Streptomyces sedi]